MATPTDDVIGDLPITDGWNSEGGRMMSDDEGGEEGVEGGGEVSERRTVGGAVGEAAVDEPPEVGRAAGRSGEPRDRRAQLPLADHVVVGQASQRHVAERQHLPDVDAEREHVGRRRVGAVDGRVRRGGGGRVDVDGGGGEQLGRRPADGDEALPQRDVVSGVDVAAERRRAELDVERRGEQDVAGGHVAVDEAQVDRQVVKPGGDLTAHGQLLDETERRKTNRRRARGAGGSAVFAHRQQELLQITLQQTADDQPRCTISYSWSSANV